MGDNFIVRIALPELRHEAKEYNSPNYIGEGRLRLFYDRAIQPAAVEILPDNLVRLWPPNFDNEMFRAGNFARDVVDPADRRRLPQHTSRDVHAQYLNPWLDAIRRRVAEDPLLDFARGFLLLVEGKGTKNRDGVSHRPPAEDLIDDGMWTFSAHRVLESHNRRTARWKLDRSRERSYEGGEPPTS